MIRSAFEARSPRRGASRCERCAGARPQRPLPRGRVSQADAEFVCGAMEWVAGGRSRHGRLAFTVNLNRTECEVADIEALGQSSCVQGRKAR